MIKFKEAILKSISKRIKYKFEWKTVLYQVFCFPNVIWKYREKTFMNKNFKTYQSGKRKMKSELDIQNIIKSVRRSEILLSVLLSKHQQILCNYQNTSLIYPEIKENSVSPSLSSISVNSDLQTLNENNFSLNDPISLKLWEHIS